MNKDLKDGCGVKAGSEKRIVRNTFTRLKTS